MEGFMAKVLHPNQYSALLSDIKDPSYSFPEYFPLTVPLAQHVRKELEVTYTPNETSSIYYKRVNRCSWDILDKKCKYYRNDYQHGWDYANRLCNKYLGKTPKEILQLGLNHINKKLRREHFFVMGLKCYLESLHDFFNYSCSHIIINGVVHAKWKKFTTLENRSKFKYEINDLSVSKDLDYLTINKFTNFVKALELNSFEVDLDNTCATFNNNTVKGYISINPDHSFAYDLIFADHIEHWNKISRCPLVFKIPKSRQGISSALLEFDRLGNSSKELENDSYEPLHVNTHKWWLS